MGTYRFFLAITVALSHMEVTFLGGHDPGVTAVISFFLISGFVMTGLVRTYYSAYDKVPMFYLDRLARIVPQYLFFLLLTTAGFYALHFSSPYLEGLSFAGIMANLLVVPLDFFMYHPGIARCMLIPQAWSLGLELTFYLLFPFVMLSRHRGVFLLASMMVWLMAAFGALNTDAWGYRLLPGTLFMFLLGSYIYDNRHISWNHVAVRTLLVVPVCAVLLAMLGKMSLIYTFEVLLGLLLGIPALFWLARFERNEWDDILGNLSYGLFLSHFLVIWTLDALLVPHDGYGITLMLGASVMLASVGYKLVEQPVLRWRHRLRSARLLL